MKLSGTVTFTDIRSPHRGTSKPCNIGSSTQCSVTSHRGGMDEEWEGGSKVRGHVYTDG